MNADLLSTAKGGKEARRANRKDRNKLFKAISSGDFDDVEFDYDLDEAEAIERMIADEEDEMMYGGTLVSHWSCPFITSSLTRRRLI